MVSRWNFAFRCLIAKKKNKRKTIQRRKINQQQQKQQQLRRLYFVRVVQVLFCLRLYIYIDSTQSIFGNGLTLDRQLGFARKTVNSQLFHQIKEITM